MLSTWFRSATMSRAWWLALAMLTAACGDGVVDMAADEAALGDGGEFGTAAVQSGFVARYYARSNFKRLVREQVDAGINFDWGSGAPLAGMPTDSFSVRWTGSFTFAQSGTYAFSGAGDDSLQVFLDGALVVSHVVTSGLSFSKTLEVAAGTHELRVDFVERTGSAVARLGWQLVAPEPTPEPEPGPTPEPTPSEPPASGNLLTNAGFEGGLESWDNWRNSVAVTGSAYTGVYAVRIGTGEGGLSQDFAMSPGAGLTFNGYGKVGAAGEVLYAGVKFLDAAGTVLLNKAVELESTSYAPFSVDVVVPVGASRGFVFLWKDASSSYGFGDDLVLVAAGGTPPAPEPTPTPTPSDPGASSILTNGGFESGLTAYDNWGNAAAVTGQAYSGSYALRIGAAAGGLGQYVTTSAGASYRFSGRGKVGATGEILYAGAKFVDAAGTTLINPTVEVTTTSYSSFALDLTVPATAASGYVFLWKNDGASYAYADDLALVATSTDPTPPTPPTPPAEEGNPGNAVPFGSHPTTYAAGTIRPSNATQAVMDGKVRESYDNWKRDLVGPACGGYVVKFGSGKLTVSEGVGYGMLITVAMAGYDAQAREIFDGLLRVARDHGSTVSPYLMSWYVDFSCNDPDPWPAADGDLDIALALLMAHRQWGSAGSVNYLAEAKLTIGALKTHLLSPTKKLVMAKSGVVVRTSDMMINHFRAFQRATGDATWQATIDNSLALLDSVSSSYSSVGLQPDFITDYEGTNPRPSPGGLIESSIEGLYAWNACRNPWRLGTDFVMSGDARSKALTQKLVTYFKGVTGNDPNKVINSRYLDGSLYYVPTPGGWDGNSMSFQAPLALGAMVDTSNQAFLDAFWTKLVSNQALGYYDHEIQLLTMMVVSGNWWQP